jgi:hypothetical protein
MKRNENPLSASIVDAICRPTSPSGNSALLAASRQWLQEPFSIAIIASTLFYAFSPLQQSFPGYDSQVKALFPLGSNVMANSFNKLKLILNNRFKYYS